MATIVDHLTIVWIGGHFASNQVLYVMVWKSNGSSGFNMTCYSFENLILVSKKSSTELPSTGFHGTVDPLMSFTLKLLEPRVVVLGVLVFFFKVLL